MGGLLNRWREYPITLLCIVVCIGLYWDSTKPNQTSAERNDELDRLGAVVDRPVSQANQPNMIIFRGPTTLWQGELWRIPVCAFHHVDFMHLLMNCLSALYLGRILERRWGSRRMLLFLPAATFFPLIPEFLAGNYVVGFSGVIAAMFGVLCVLRYQDEALQEELPAEAVQMGGAMLALGVFFAMTDLMPVANLAHMTGFFWGALVGSVSTGLPWGRSVARMIWFAAVIFFLGSLWWIVHPPRDGLYHWYLALQTNDAKVRLAELKRTVELEPQAVTAWKMLANEELQQGHTLEAWKTLLTGLSHNPTDTQLMQLARMAWFVVVNHPGREAAEQALAEVFGDQAENWGSQFRWNFDWTLLDDASQETNDPVAEFPLGQALDLKLPKLPPDVEKEFAPHRIPPDGDAVEGRRL